MTHATRDRRPRHKVAAERPERPEGPPDGGGVGESRPVKEGSRGRPGRHRVKTMPDRGRKDGPNGELRHDGDDITQKGIRRTQTRARKGKWKRSGEGRKCDHITAQRAATHLSRRNYV